MVQEVISKTAVSGVLIPVAESTHWGSARTLAQAYHGPSLRTRVHTEEKLWVQIVAEPIAVSSFGRSPSTFQMLSWTCDSSLHMRASRDASHPR